MQIRELKSNIYIQKIPSERLIWKSVLMNISLFFQDFIPGFAISLFIAGPSKK